MNLGVVAASRALGVSVRTVRRWVVEGRLTNVGTARCFLIPLEDVERNTPDVRAMRRLRDNLTTGP